MKMWAYLQGPIRGGEGGRGGEGEIWYAWNFRWFGKYEKYGMREILDDWQGLQKLS